MGLRLRIVPSYTIDGSAGEPIIVGITEDSSVNGVAAASSLTWHNNHTVVANTSGLTTIGYSGTDSSIKDTLSDSLTRRTAVLNDVLFVNDSGSEAINSYYIDPTTGHISLWSSNDVSGIIGNTGHFMTATSDRLIVNTTTGNGWMYSFSSDASGNLNVDTSIDLTGSLYAESDGIFSNGNGIVYTCTRDASSEGAYIRSFEVSTGSMTLVDTGYIFNEYISAAIYGYPYCTSTKMWVSNGNYGYTVYIYDIDDTGILGNRIDVSAGDPTGEFIAISNNSPYAITERFAAEPWLGQYAGLNVYDVSSGEFIIDVSTPSGKWNTQYGKTFIKDTSLEFSIAFSNYAENFTLDISTSVGDPSIHITPNNLKIVRTTSDLGGVADFNNNFVTVISTGQGGSDDFRRGAIFKWKMWLDNDSGYANDLFNLDSSTGNPTGHLKSWMIDSSLYISVVGIAFNAYDISGLDNQILDCELTGGFGTYPQELKINNEVQAGTNTIPSVTATGGIYIGTGSLLVWGQNLDSLDNGTVWDIQTETSLGVPTHAWAGYPAGDTLGAWVDTIGTLDATLVGPTATRDIQGGGTTGKTSVLLIGDTATPPVPGAYIISFTTNASTLTFDPVFTTSSGTLTWDLGDGSIVSSNSFAHTYTSAGNKTVDVSQGTASGPESILTINMYYDNLVGVLDISALSNLQGSFNVGWNDELTSVLLPDSSQVFTEVNVDHCDITGTWDLRGLTNIGGIIDMGFNPNLTAVLLPDTSNLISTFAADNCNIIGTLDVSALTGLNNSFNVSGNSNLTKILLPETVSGVVLIVASDCNLTGTLDISNYTNTIDGLLISGNINLTNILLPASNQEMVFDVGDCSLSGTIDISAFTNLKGNMSFANNAGITKILFPPTSSITPITQLYAYNCNLIGSIDVSGLTFRSSFDFQNNPQLSEILLPDFNYPFSQFYVQDCSLNQSTVDDIFVKLNTYYSGIIEPTSSLYVRVQGGTNMPPTDGSSNADLLNLITIFSDAGQTFVYSIN